MIREAVEKDRIIFDKLARHPLQSWAWGEFRKQAGVEVLRLVQADEKKIREVYQITWHKIPKIKRYIGYCPKSAIPDAEAMKGINKEAGKKGAIMVKFEPNEKDIEASQKQVRELAGIFDFRAGKPLFTKYTFQLDISKSEEEILKNMNQKTRYNVRLAEKKGVKIVEDNSEEAFEEYWKLTEETTKRQKFFAHGKSYHRKMWQTMIVNGGGHLLKAIYEGKTLTTWVLFELNDVLYYPYGASSNQNKEVMASNLMMWETIKLGKKHGCKMFDMWGSMGPEPDRSDPWYGFHRFKQGYGGELTEFVGTYDLVVNRTLYKIYILVDKLRWIVLKLLAKLRK
ncbi:peptidoglycan bridge formation protein FemAB [Candidatus Collierbacteria bacterium CG10_big_fil_rev_8_21_14_0_10_43_36]|uniref:Peptidoglycan bridge formation protein FemAB n=3 Tax=Candidatus Collieribacteriota TaxID=1752725 RepID=A0A2H0DVN1_9BACT|nr:MAG: peptidoglycan bridge formation protein FemAB [Candidatus Collierbacteria bacterium CG22_combo_CG10-13_8_21_14_all_43_12]PIR99803.1 MAG: peptidoglycan bridge formation protein FemAB [Candidatus Collierbacteria bacterium CG10_big_fil_rev_8_21_14_0_10_43_36]PIZ24750.1 MAG: peptidoglycan bridge formation protein FemAB [Candidatus Collierbacteria bacterium CG_4_10_14_0_8_um_filter_43_86]PJB47120.1 MAG: peptidoglycan bridge formation protein FemAB [Candidatus Collierbacteria bacterium CG_4_9_1